MPQNELPPLAHDSELWDGDSSHIPPFNTAFSSPSGPNISDPPSLEKPMGSKAADASMLRDYTGREEFQSWGITDPYRTSLKRDENPWEACFTRIRKIDDEMCKGWREEMDTLLIFAGLFSATVTAFTVESYQWLQESPADTLARLQLRALLNETRDPAMDIIAPSSFVIRGSVVCINTLWFVSLTLALTLVVVSLLCKQWLYEYQRYENLTAEQSFLIRELRFKGLQGWYVPTIIGFLPLLLQAALVLFLVGLLTLLWSLQTAVASIITVIVGAILIVLAGTTLLPTIQYALPVFGQQCPYKSSQSWLLFLVSASWLPEVNIFTSWVALDLWEVTHIHQDKVSSLCRLHELFSTSLDVVINIYHLLVDAARLDNPFDNAFSEQFVAHEFINKIQVKSHSGDMGHLHVDNTGTIKPTNGVHKPATVRLQRLQIYLQRQLPHSLNGLLGVGIDNIPSHKEYWDNEMALAQYLGQYYQMPDPQIRNRHIEHCIRLLDIRTSIFGPPPVLQVLQELQNSILSAEEMDWDNELASHIIGSFTHMFERKKMKDAYVQIIWDTILRSLINTHHRNRLDRSPYCLFMDIEQWLSRTPDMLTRAERSRSLLSGLYRDYTRQWDNMTFNEKKCTKSLIQFIVDICDRDDSATTMGMMGSDDVISLGELRAHLSRR